MSVTFQLPKELESDLRSQIEDLDSEAKESLLVELYRRDKITRIQLSQALAIDRLETDALLKEHNVTEDLLTLEEFEEDLANLQRPPKTR